MTTHDPMCQVYGRTCMCGALREHNARVRADEREQQTAGWAGLLDDVQEVAAKAAEERDAARAEVTTLREALDIAQAQLKGWVAERKRLEAVFAEKDALIEELIDALEDVVNQACYVSDDYEGGSHLDSMALSAYAHAMRTLSKLGRITVEHEYGRRVIGRWVPTEQEE